MTHMDDKGIPMDTLHKAVCVIVIPNLKKGGFIIGAKYGKGFISCRRAKRRRLDRAGRYANRGRKLRVSNRWC